MVERAPAQAVELFSVTSNLTRLLFVVVSRKTFQIYNIQMGGLAKLQKRCWAAEEEMFAEVQRQNLNRHIG